MSDPDSGWYLVVRHRFAVPNTSAGVQVIRGGDEAAKAIIRWAETLSVHEREEGWHFYRVGVSGEYATVWAPGSALPGNDDSKPVHVFKTT